MQICFVIKQKNNQRQKLVVICGLKPGRRDRYCGTEAVASLNSIDRHRQTPMEYIKIGSFALLVEFYANFYSYKEKKLSMFKNSWNLWTQAGLKRWILKNLMLSQYLIL